MKTTKYVNDFLFFAVNSDSEGAKDKLLICSGINLDRFLPLTRGRYGIGGNPILSGLQLVKYDMCALAISKGGTSRDLTGNPCSGIVPTREGWYTESLQMENAADLSPDEIINFGVGRLVQKIVVCSRLGYQAPDKLLAPNELQAYLETLCDAMPKAA